MRKIYDCITFFNENFITNIRFEIIHKEVDYFIVCESKYDHKSNKKNINFKLKNKKFRNKVIHLVLDTPFSSKTNAWQNQATQREHIFHALKIRHMPSFAILLIICFPTKPDPPKIITVFMIFLKLSDIASF